MTPCPSCGAPLGGRTGCQAAFDDLSARAWSTPLRGSVHNLVVDAYAMQHTEDYARSAKSYAAHLTGLCCAIESGGARDLYCAIPRWLDRSVALERPPDLAARGALTIADVLTACNDLDHVNATRRWAEAVWAAYAVQHPLAREWVAAARQQCSTERRRTR